MSKLDEYEAALCVALGRHGPADLHTIYVVRQVLAMRRCAARIASRAVKAANGDGGRKRMDAADDRDLERINNALAAFGAFRAVFNTNGIAPMVYVRRATETSSCDQRDHGAPLVEGWPL